MIVHFDDGYSIKVRWQHDRNEDARLLTEVPNAGITSCFLGRLDAEMPGAIVGMARCSLKDTYCRQAGRKWSLRRALAKTGLTRSQRRHVWYIYDQEIGLVKKRRKR